MASGHSQREVDPSITHIEEDEVEQIASETHFVDISDILKTEIKEETTEFKPFSEYGVPSEYQQKNEDEKFYDPNSSEFEVMSRNCTGDSIESKSPTQYGTRLQRNTAIEENETTVERENDEKREPTLTMLYPFESEQEFYEETHTEKKPFQCESCSKSFTGKYKLSRHEKIHTGEKPFQCKKCPKSFTANYSLLTHERLHTGEKPFPCKNCPKSFTTRYNLLVHERIHTGERPFQCKLCPKSFVEKHTLLYHERIHRGEKPFQCKVCPKSFVEKKYLTRHERVHSGEHPFRCKFCTKLFMRKDCLVLHERIHTGEKPFECNICLKSFAAKSNLLSHEKIHKGENATKFSWGDGSKSHAQEVQFIRQLQEKVHTVVKSTRDELLESQTYEDSYREFIWEKSHLS